MSVCAFECMTSDMLTIRVDMYRYMESTITHTTYVVHTTHIYMHTLHIVTYTAHINMLTLHTTHHC